MHCAYCYTQTLCCYSVILLLKHRPTLCQRVQSKNTPESSLYPTGAKQNWTRERVYLKDLRGRPDAELCGIPFIPSTQCPGQWYPSNIRWAGEILGLSAASAAKNPDVRLQKWNAASQARSHNSRPDQYSLIFTVSEVLYWGLCGLSGVRVAMTWYDIISYHELIFSLGSLLSISMKNTTCVGSTVCAFRDNFRLLCSKSITVLLYESWPCGTKAY